MKQYLKFVLSVFGMAFIIFEVIVIGILKFPENVFHSSYQSLIQDKYRILKETNAPKIIMISGSSSAFGLNQVMLEEATGYKVANLGLHGGFGNLFYTELAKANINEGDIVLLGYEYGWQYGFQQLDQKLVMSGIDSDIEMYTQIPVFKYRDIIGWIFKYAEVKNSFSGTSGLFSRDAFDSETGQMIQHRDSVMEYSAEVHGTVSIDGSYICDEAVNYLLSFKEYVEEKGADIYFVAPPIIEDSIVCDYNEFNKLKELEEEKIGIPYISNPTDYFFSCELMFDSLYHCNSQGENVRTELLINDLKAVLKNFNK